MVSNFEEVITGLRQCQEKLFSDNGVMGCLVSIEVEVEDVKTILFAIDDPHAHEIIFLLSRVLELIHIIYDQDLQSYDKRARELEKKIQGRAYFSSSFNISGEVKTDVFVTHGSAAGGVREPEVQLRPVEEAKVEGLPPTAKGKDTEVPKDLESPQPTPSKNVTPNQGWQTEAIERGIHPSLVQGEQVARDALGIERDGLSHVQYDKVNNVYYENPQQVTNALGKWEKNKDVHGTVIRGPENPYPRLRIFDDTLAPADYTTAPMGGLETKLNYSITPAEKFNGRIPQEATDLARYTWSEEIPDRGIRVFKNKDLKTKEKILPDKTINGDNIRYFEIDVRDAGYIMRDEPRLPVKRDNERLVVGSNGDIYYTPNHYKDFVLLRRS